MRAKVIRARDIPMGFGDMDASLYLLFKAIREHSTVALSGESADEVFGGYKQFFDEDARSADTFPWLVKFAEQFGDDAGLLRPDLAAALNVPAYIKDSLRHRRRRRSNAWTARATSSTGCARSATST